MFLKGIGVHPFRHFFRHFPFWRFRHPYKTLGPPLYLKSSRFLKNLSVSALIFSVSAPIVSFSAPTVQASLCIYQPVSLLVEKFEEDLQVDAFTANAKSSVICEMCVPAFNVISGSHLQHFRVNVII